MSLAIVLSLFPHLLDIAFEVKLTSLLVGHLGASSIDPTFRTGTKLFILFCSRFLYYLQFLNTFGHPQNLVISRYCFLEHLCPYFADTFLSLLIGIFYLFNYRWLKK